MKTNKSQNSKSIPTGYKQTEMGIIPEDWKVSSIGNLCVIFGRIGFRGYTKSDIVSQDQGVLSISPSNIFDGRTNFTHGTYITRQKYEESPEIKIYEGDILLVKTGSTYGKIALVKNLKEDATLNPQVVVFKRLKSPAAFLAYIMQSDIVQNQIEETIVGGAIPTLSQKVVLSFKIPLPTPREQLAIANVLSDTDALIIAIEQLIAKKKDIKTATMQQLLTGRTRLPQFYKYPDGTFKGYKSSDFGLIPEDWNIVCIQEVGVVDPENLSVNTQRNYAFNYISLESIDAGSLLETTKHTFSTAPSRARRVLRFNDLLVSTVRPNLMSHYFIANEVQNLIGSTGFSVIRCKQQKFCAAYLYQHLFHSVINKQIDMLITGSNYPAINSTDVKSLKFPVGGLEEQTAIATILSDMDAELTALEQKLAKFRDIKQGMMQQLLTGRIRLPLDQQP